MSIKRRNYKKNRNKELKKKLLLAFLPTLFLFPQSFALAKINNGSLSGTFEAMSPETDTDKYLINALSGIITNTSLGMRFESSGGGAIENHGAINMDSGEGIEFDTKGDTTVLNTGSINIQGNGRDSTGIFYYHVSSAAPTVSSIFDINNQGSIIIKEGRNNSGIKIEADNEEIPAYVKIVNSDNISITSSETDSASYGIEVFNTKRAELVNAQGANISVTGVNARGISFSNRADVATQEASSIANFGTMVVEGGNSAYGIALQDIVGNETNSIFTLNNSGEIQVRHLGVSDPYTTEVSGFYIDSNNYSDIVIHNTGIINVTSSDALVATPQVFLAANSMSPTGAPVVKKAQYITIGNYALTLRDFSNDLRDPFQGDNSGTNANGHLKFNPDSVFLLSPGTPEDGFAYNTYYAISDMITGLNFDYVASPDHKLTKVSADIPMVEARLDSNNQAVGLFVEQDPEKNVGLLNSLPVLQNALVRKDLMDNQLFSQMAFGQNLPRWSFFASPYAGVQHQDFGSTSSDSTGIMGGFSHNFEKMSLGFHFDLNYSDTESAVYQTKTKSFSGAFGVHGNFRPHPNWYVDTRFTAFIGQNETDYVSDTITPMSADSDYNNYIYVATAKTGYIWHINNDNKITSEVDLTYLHMDMDKYDVNWRGGHLTSYNYHQEGISHGNLYGQFKVRWDGNFAINDFFSIQPYIMAGVKYNVTGEEIKSNFDYMAAEFGGDSDSVEGTTILSSAGLNFTHGAVVLQLSYYGDYNHQGNYHSGSANITFRY